MKVLIIDTDNVISKTLVDLLEKRSCSTHIVRSAQNALDALDNYGPDVVVMEPQLGPHNGIEFLYEMRSHADVDHVPVFIYSTNRNVLDERFQPAWRMASTKVFYKPATSPKQLVMEIMKTKT